MRLELTTPCLKGRCSNRLSYGPELEINFLYYLYFGEKVNLLYAERAVSKQWYAGMMHEIVIAISQYAIIVPMLAYAWLVYSERRQLKSLIIFTVISLIITLLIAKLAATLHADPRPFVRDGVTPYFKHGTDNGFPSDHTTYSSLIAFIIMRYNRKLGIALAVVALLIGAARVVAGVHHTQDIVAGFFIAAISVYAAKLISDRVVAKLSSRKR